MKATFLALGVALGALLTVSSAQAQYFCPTIPTAPDARGCGYYQQNYYGQWFGPNYCVYPPFAPFQGMVFPPCPPAQAAFPSHPYARSPRDFFMYEARDNK